MPGGTNDPAPTVTRGELLSPTVAAEPDGGDEADASRATTPVAQRKRPATSIRTAGTLVAVKVPPGGTTVLAR